MSRSYEAEYALEREVRRQIAAARVRETTEQFYRRYMSQFEELQRKGAAIYIPDEMAQLESDLEQIRSSLISNPFEARDISQRVGRYIHGLHGLLRSTERQFDLAVRMQAQARREKKKEQVNEALNEYYRQLQEISPSVANFGMESFQELREKITSGKITSAEQVCSQISSICKSAEKQAAEWKCGQQAREKTEAAKKRLQEAAEFVQQQQWEDNKKTQEFSDRITKLREDLKTGNVSPEEIVSSADNIEAAVDEEKIAEEVRRQAVRAIMKQLRAQEFTVSKPQLINRGGETYVVITAQQPSGRRAACKIDLRGKVAYRFDRYQGMTCLKDIQRFNVDLEHIYSIKLSDERVLWENPDRLTHSEDSNPNGNGERSHN